MTEKRLIPVNGPTIEVMPKADEPLVLTTACASTVMPSTGEEFDIVGVLGRPFLYHIRGEKLTGIVDVSSVIQEALLHVLKENA